MTFPALIATAVLAAAAAAPPPAPPQLPAGPQQFPDFDAMDANHDGKVTKAEFMAALAPEQRAIGERVFTARDANKDGVLTREEMAPPPRQ